MAKLSRSSLKALVKECLVEILAEGIGNDSAEMISESRSSSPTRKRRTNSSARKKVEPNTKFNSALDKTVNMLTEDSVMKDILADTARTTFQEQHGKEVSTHRTAPSQLSQASNSPAGVDLGGIFDSAKSSWSDIAFSGPKNNAAK